MIASYLKIASRNILKRKLYSFINAFGLSIGIAFCMLIYLYIQDEKSFDQFNERKDRIFMITEKGFNREAYEKGDPEPYDQSAYLPAKLADVMLEEIPEVAHVTRINGGEGIMTVGDKIMKQEVSFVDSGFFKIFSFSLIKGNPNKLFRNSNDAVLTETVSKVYFGDEDPIGKIFTFGVDEVTTFTVAGVIADAPPNSSIDFKILLPIENRPFFKRSRDNWGNFSYPTFIQLKEKSSVSSFQANLHKITEKYLSEKFKQWRERGKIPPQYIVNEFLTTSLNDVHLNTKVSWTRVSDPAYSVILGGIAALILLIACINYISLALTTSASRRIEVGIRKVVGAYKTQLIYQFGLESVLLAVISLIGGVILVVLFLPAFNSFTGKGIALNLTNITRLLSSGLFLSLLVGILAVSYPAFFLSRFLPSSVLKGRSTTKLQAGFTKPLVVLQFALSAFLIISSVIMFKQMDFVTRKDLGYNQNQIIAIPTQAGWSEQADLAVERFREKVKNLPDVLGVTGTSSSFNQGWSRYGYRIKDENKSAFVYRVDPEYIKLLNINIIEGRNFDSKIASDSTGVIVNEALVRDMGWKDPTNEYLNWREDSLGLGSKVIGVVKDYHFLSLERDIEPMFLSMDKKQVGYLTTMMVKISDRDIPGTIEKLRVAWKELSPDKPFEYTFVDEDVAKQYDKYKRWMNIAGLSTAFAILIASLGLFGLAGINAINKTKEIGIRKVLGAQVLNIFVLLNKQYIWLALIAFAIATPFSWWMMNRWLDDFKFKITINWQLFAISMAGGLLVALLTVSYHAVKAALINPADTLKYE